jgi:hypothetical protein
MRGTRLSWGRWRWLILLLLVLLVWGGGVLWVNLVKQAKLAQVRVPGDALTDDFFVLLEEARTERHNPVIRALIQRFNPRWDYKPFPLVERVLDWEPKYRDDPRYWQLVAYVAEVMDDSQYREVWKQGLQAQLDRGITTPASVSLLLSSFRPTETEEEIQEDLAYREQLTALFPDSAYFSYYLGASYLNLGETDLAWEQFKLSNEATDTAFPRRYPASAVMEYYNDFKSPESQLLAGWIISSEPLENYIKRKEDAKCVEECLALGLPVELGDDYYNTLLTRGLLDGQETLGPWVHIVITNMYLEYCHDELFTLNAQQEQEYQDIHDSLQLIQDDYKNGGTVLNFSNFASMQFSFPNYLENLQQLTIQDGQADFRRVALRKEFAKVCESALIAVRCRPLSAWAGDDLAGVSISPKIIQQQVNAVLQQSTSSSSQGMSTVNTP